MAPTFKVEKPTPNKKAKKSDKTSTAIAKSWSQRSESPTPSFASSTEHDSSHAPPFRHSTSDITVFEIEVLQDDKNIHNIDVKMYSSETFEKLIDKLIDLFGDFCDVEYKGGLNMYDGRPIFKTDSPESIDLKNNASLTFESSDEDLSIWDFTGSEY